MEERKIEELSDGSFLLDRIDVSGTSREEVIERVREAILKEVVKLSLEGL